MNDEIIEKIGKGILELRDKEVKAEIEKAKATYEEAKEDARRYISTLDRHTRAMCAHVEALGMDARNKYNELDGCGPTYFKGSYEACLKKWGLVDENGAPK